MLGLTFKEDVPDLRNSKVADLIAALAAHGHSVAVHDPLADAAEAAHEYGLNLQTGDLPGQHDLVVLAVPHRAYLSLGADALSALVAPGGLFADLKNGLGAMRDNMSVALWRL
jgi:UDP-N-acetyl-D-galactosamine dehydrogenase